MDETCPKEKKQIRDLAGIPTVLCSKDETVSAEDFDIMQAIKDHISPGPYSWDDMYISIERYPSFDPYLEVDRTKMPGTRPCGGSITFVIDRPDGKVARFSIPDFYDLKEQHHNPEFWWIGFDGKFGFSKEIKGHTMFPIATHIKAKVTFGADEIVMPFKAFSGRIRIRALHPSAENLES